MSQLSDMEQQFQADLSAIAAKLQAITSGAEDTVAQQLQPLVDQLTQLASTSPSPAPAPEPSPAPPSGNGSTGN